MLQGVVLSFALALFDYSQSSSLEAIIAWLELETLASLSRKSIINCSTSAKLRGHDVPNFVRHSHRIDSTVIVPRTPRPFDRTRFQRHRMRDR